jgi:hypothetical protein
MRATASSYIVAEKSPAAKKKLDNAAKPSILVTDLHHDEAIKY